MASARTKLALLAALLAPLLLAPVIVPSGIGQPKIVRGSIGNDGWTAEEIVEISRINPGMAIQLKSGSHRPAGMAHSLEDDKPIVDAAQARAQTLGLPLPLIAIGGGTYKARKYDPTHHTCCKDAELVDQACPDQVVYRQGQADAYNNVCHTVYGASTTCQSGGNAGERCLRDVTDWDGDGDTTESVSDGHLADCGDGVACGDSTELWSNSCLERVPESTWDQQVADLWDTGSPTADDPWGGGTIADSRHPWDSQRIETAWYEARYASDPTNPPQLYGGAQSDGSGGAEFKVLQGSIDLTQSGCITPRAKHLVARLSDVGIEPGEAFVYVVGSKAGYHARYEGTDEGFDGAPGVGCFNPFGDSTPGGFNQWKSGAWHNTESQADTENTQAPWCPGPFATTQYGLGEYQSTRETLLETLRSELIAEGYAESDWHVVDVGQVVHKCKGCWSNPAWRAVNPWWRGVRNPALKVDNTVPGAFQDASLSVTPAGTLSRTITEGGTTSDHTRDVANDGDAGSSLDWSVSVQSQQDCGGTTGEAWATATGSGTGLSPGDPSETATEGYASESGCAPGTYTATIRYTSAEADDSPVDRTLELVVQQQVASNSADACDANADCLCYEPLNADDGPFGLDALVDPSDSATKDCTTFFVEGGGDTVSSIPGESGLDMPGSGVSWVWEVEQEGNPSVQLGDSLAPSLAPGETICVRHYERANYQHLDDGPSQRARSTRMSANTGSDQAVIQWNFEPTGPSGIKFTTTFLGADDNCPATAGSDDVTMDEINSSWARLEHCMDHAADGTVHFRARITVLDTARQWTSACVETGSSGGSTINFGQFWPAQAFSQSGEAGWLRWKSHAGTWKKSFDQSFWPPTACEVEGGC